MGFDDRDQNYENSYNEEEYQEQEYEDVYSEEEYSEEGYAEAEYEDEGEYDEEYQEEEYEEYQEGEEQQPYEISGGEIDDEVLAYVEYDLNHDDVFTALKQFQKEMQSKRNILWTAILLALFGFYIYQIIFNANTSSIAYFLSGLVLVIIGVIWYLPYRHRKSVAAAADSDDFLYNMYFYDTYAAVKHEEGIHKVDLQSESVKVREFADKYCVFFGRTTMFIIPKRCVSEDQKDMVERILKENAGDRYKVIEQETVSAD